MKLVSLMPNEDKNFGGFLVLDLRIMIMTSRENALYHDSAVSLFSSVHGTKTASKLSGFEVYERKRERIDRNRYFSNTILKENNNNNRSSRIAIGFA